MYVRKLYRRSVVITTNAMKTTNVPPVVHNEANMISNQSLQLRNKEFKNTCQQSVQIDKTAPYQQLLLFDEVIKLH